MNITEWQTLPPEEFLAKLRDAQMSREEYKAILAAIAADERMVADMTAAGTLPTQLPEGKLGDNDSWGTPTLWPGADRRGL
jgi:hypothetical protein